LQAEVTSTLESTRKKKKNEKEKEKRRVWKMRKINFNTLLRLSIILLSIAFMAKLRPVPHNSTKCTLPCQSQVIQIFQDTEKSIPDFCKLMKLRKGRWGGKSGIGQKSSEYHQRNSWQDYQAITSSSNIFRKIRQKKKKKGPSFQYRFTYFRMKVLIAE
jgi:hypothetical protein